jgi:hypothetical protein
MQIPIPSKFQSNLDTYRKQVLETGFITINLQEYIKNITFSVLLQLGEDTNKKLEEIVKSKVPLRILEKLYIQPYTGFHITLQSTKIPNNDIGMVVEDLVNYIKNIQPFKVNIVGPYHSHRNLFFAVTTDISIIKIREDIENIYNKYRLTSHLPVGDDLMWISVCRFPEELNKEDTDFLLNNLEQEHLENIDVKKIIITKNDPIFSKDSPILKEYTFDSVS